MKKKQIRETLSLRLSPMALEFVRRQALALDRTQASIIEEAVAEMMFRNMKGESVDAWTNLGLAISASGEFFSQIHDSKKKKKTS